MPAAGIPRVLAIANGKGGVYKTSASAAIAGLTARAGLRTLLIDMDPQGNLTEELGLDANTDEGEGTYQSLRRRTPLATHPTGRDGLEIVYGGSSLAEAELTLPNTGGGLGWQHALAECLEPIADGYDLIVIDCPPRSPALTLLAITSARYVLIPTKPDKSSRKGMREVAALFAQARDRNPELELLGVVLTGLEERATSIRASARAIVEDSLQGIAPIMGTVIRHASAAGFQVREHGRMPHELELDLEAQEREHPWYDQLRAGADLASVRLPRSASAVAQDYADLTREVLDAIAAAEARQTAAEEQQ